MLNKRQMNNKFITMNVVLHAVIQSETGFHNFGGFLS